MEEENSGFDIALRLPVFIAASDEFASIAARYLKCIHFTDPKYFFAVRFICEVDGSV
jgi:hypothetical protein